MTMTKTKWIGPAAALVGILTLMAVGTPGFAVDVDGTIADEEYSASLTVSDGEYELFWSLDADTAHFAIRARTEGWVALGIEPELAMNQADMIFGWVEGDGSVVVLDAFATGMFGPHPPDEELGGTTDLLDYAGREVDGVTVLEFSRPVDTGDSYDKPLLSEGEVKVIWAIGGSDGSQSPHIRRGGATLVLSGGEPGGSAEAASSAGAQRGAGVGRDLYSLLYPVHAILMGTAFVLLFVGMFFPRYFKGKKWWLKSHRRIGIAGGVIGVIGVGMAVYMISRTTQIHLRVLHSYIGLVSIILMIFMPLLGHFMLKIRGNPTRAKRARAAHRWIGRLTLLFMAATIVLGLFQAGIL
jgi:hypothetical protein